MVEQLNTQNKKKSYLKNQMDKKEKEKGKGKEKNPTSPSITGKRKAEETSSTSKKLKVVDSDPRVAMAESIEASLTSNETFQKTPKEISIEIEEQLFKKFGGLNEQYKAKLRSLKFNLKDPKNPGLRQSVLNGEISAERLCSMSPQEMASDELKKERERINKKNEDNAKLPEPQVTTSSMYKCGKCGKRETTFFQMQTRSADEPMTVFHHCTNCGNRWRS